MEEKVYVIGRGLRIFLAICVTLLAGLGIVIMTIPFWDGNPDAAYVVMMAVFGLILAIPSVLGLVAVFKSRLTVTADRFILVNFIKPKEMLFGDIAGFRRDNAGALLLVPKDASRKVLGIASHFGGFDDLVARVSSRWENLDGKDLAAEEEKILTDKKLGETRDHVKSRLSFAKNLAMAVNGAAIVISLYGMVYPRPYNLVAAALCIIPLVAVAMALFSRGMIQLDEERNSPLPGVFTAFFMPLAILALRGILDWNFIAGTRFYIVFAAATIALWGLMMFISKWMGKKIWVALLMLPLMALCAFGAVVVPNCLLDRSAPKLYYLKVDSKEISRGSKHTSYYLHVAPWGGYDERRLSVGRERYEAAREGDIVTVGLREGLFGIPWYDVTRE